MILVSNYVLDDMGIPFPQGTISRLNLAWMLDKEHAQEVLSKIHNEVFLDYPHGREKPPKPNLTISDALELAQELHVRYFAISNVEEYEDMKDLRSRMPAHVELVPKIETKRGVRNLPSILEGAKTKYAMLDKEDLYNDVSRDVDVFEILIDSARTAAKLAGATLLELRGVVFS